MGPVRQGATNGGDWGDWVEVRSRRRKAPREVDAGFNGQRERSRHNHRHGSVTIPWQSRPSGRSRDSEHHWLQNRDFEEHHRDGMRQIQQHAEESYKLYSFGQHRSYSRQARYHQNNAQVAENRNNKTQVLGHGLKQQGLKQHGEAYCYEGQGSDTKRYVSFYFTNVPPFISLFNLRKGFEVCGILEDVYVPSKRNIHGEVYGFVKFSNVKDVEKMVKALNAVCFGQYRVHARVARFDRNAAGEGRNKRVNTGEIKMKEVAKNNVDPVKGGGDSAGGVKIGDVMVQLGDNKDKEGTVGAKARVLRPVTDNRERQPEKEYAPDNSVLMRKYNTTSDDLQWAREGVVATVINGEAIPIIQNRIMDAGFNELAIIPLGADKVFVRTSSEMDVVSILNGARDFFKLIFSAWVRWDKEVVPAQRGAWVRLYGIPLHAWNESFFRLCVMDCGRFLRADSCSVDRVRLDYALVLLATSSLEVIKGEEKLLIDGELFEIKFFEEWGLALGEDSCLFDEDSDSKADHLAHAVEHEDPKVCKNADLLVKRLVEDLEFDKEDGVDKAAGLDTSVQPALVQTGQGRDPILEQVPSNDHKSCVQETGDLSKFSGGHVTINEKKSNDDSKESMSHHKKRNMSCPPGTERPIISGPWSLEWLHDHNHGDAGVIFSAKKRSKRAGRQITGLRKEEDLGVKKKKAEGMLRHSSLKKVARLPSEDRREVLKILKKNASRYAEKTIANQSGEVRHHGSSDEASSSNSVNNDWQNWVVMHGNESTAAADVRGIGEVLGLHCNVNNKNMFSALSRAGKGKMASKDVAQGEKNPLIVCLQETKLQSCDNFLCSTLWGGTPHAFSFRPSVGASGGLLTLWDTTEVEVWSSTSCEYVLWCHGRFLKSGEEFFIANVYAPCALGAKRALWDSLSGKILSLDGRRVCVCGDFNAVRSVEERRSTTAESRFEDMPPFNRFIDDNNLIDLPLSGRKFTWYKGDGRAMSRLDRFLLSEEWCVAWPNCVQMAQLRGLSDHCPVVLSADEENWGPRPARMLKCWQDIPGYKLFVRDKWNTMQIDGWGGFVLKEKFKRIKLALKEWHGAHSQNLPSRIESLKARLSVLDNKGEEEDLLEDELAELHGLSTDIHSLSRLNASICWQQSRSLWLKEGDANSKFFHSVLASRRRRNTISSIQVDEVILEGVQPIRQAVYTHFASHFKASNVVRHGLENLQFRRLNHLEGGSLTIPFTLEEVKTAVWDCDSYKSPGPDGINFGFIKDFWPEMQAEIMRFITEFHRNGKLTKGLNSTFIALIPKVDCPQRLNDFRPISLVGSLYKILAKVLANRLRAVIGNVISEAQTAFVKDRQILDGILIANEVVDEARKCKKELLLFKVDFEKAYDSVDWGYLDEVMGRMSFPTLWRKWMKECVCTARASVLVNGSPTDEFPLERGLRQGDPLSPFLFLLAAEGLNVVMKAMVEQNMFSGYTVGTLNPISVSHLQFADDTLLLGTKSWANVRALRAALVLFELMSGLKVNFNKSMLVGVNIPVSWVNEAATALRCKVGKVPFLYLGLPIGGDPRRLSFWEPVVSRVQSRLSGWKSRFLSFGGRLILLKSVLTSLPVYALSFFKAPSGTISSIESLLINFFWGGSEDIRKTSWISWKTICLPKEYGGLGVRQLREFNIALLGKWCWRMLVDRDGLWFRVLVSRYGEERGRLREGGGVGLVGGGRLRGFEMEVGERRGVWEWRRQLWAWEEEMLGECQGLLHTVSLQAHSPDSWQWQLDPIRGYLVRDVYQLLTSQEYVPLDAANNLLWHKQVPLKVSIFAWRLLRDRLPTRVNLATRGIIDPDAQLCVSGCGGVESAQHLFISCSVFGSLWSLVRSWIGVHSVDPQSLPDHFYQFTYSSGGSLEIQKILYLTCWIRSSYFLTGG
ncbi:cysteine-rich receptor-like protein kinase [Trifolium medium]|uniref:Cysteine-rich receptor-like protein kinase n=1 Tax=Trifolium medium TaxID=97028 RepID=A0A392LWD3_9FABA|nr:cysteine-rich receptor-like protein kinase [Trifolium medium]